jgi:hypothetical protein
MRGYVATARRQVPAEVNANMQHLLLNDWL